MSAIFVLLFLASLGLLGWGLVAPKSLARHASKATKRELTRKNFAVVFGTACVLTFALVGITTPSNAQSGKPVSKSPALVQYQAVITHKTVAETKSVPFGSTSVNDANLAKGTSQVTTAGVNGVETLTYEVTYTDGKQTSKTLQKDEVTTKPVDQVTFVGTYVAPAPAKPTSTSGSNCNPNYSGYCVPDVSYDLNCSDIRHRVYVVGSDVYHFDADHDGVGCESY